MRPQCCCQLTVEVEPKAERRIEPGEPVAVPLAGEQLAELAPAAGRGLAARAGPLRAVARAAVPAQLVRGLAAAAGPVAATVAGEQLAERVAVQAVARVARQAAGRGLAASEAVASVQRNQPGAEQRSPAHRQNPEAYRQQEHRRSLPELH